MLYDASKGLGLPFASKTKPGPLLSEPRLRNVVGCGKSVDGAGEAFGVQRGSQLGFRELTFDGEGLRFGNNVVLRDTGDILHRGDGGIRALLAAEMHTSDGGLRELCICFRSRWLRRGLLTLDLAEVTGGDDRFDGLLRIGLLFGRDRDRLAFGSNGDVLADARASFDNAIGAALAAIVHAGHGDGGLCLRERGQSE